MKTIDGIMIYYRFECDDKNRPSNLDTDEYFELSEYDKVMKMKDELDFNGVNYTLLLERFNSLNDDIISRDYFIANNPIHMKTNIPQQIIVPVYYHIDASAKVKFDFEQMTEFFENELSNISSTDKQIKY